MKKETISYDKYDRLKEKTIRYGGTDLNEIINAYEYLKNKKVKDRYNDRNIENVHLNYLDCILSRSISDFASGLTEVEEEFLKSEYLSNELKKEICNIVKDNKELVKLLVSEKQINDFSKEEIKEIEKSIDFTWKTSHKDEYGYFCYEFKEYIFMLDGEGPVEYTKERYGDKLPIAMLRYSNVIDRPSYYFGYDVDRGLLGDTHLFNLYKKFVKFYPEKTEEFVKLVESIPKLTATEFVSNYLTFVHNGLDSSFRTKEGNISLEGIYGSTRDIVGVASIFASFNDDISEEGKKTIKILNADTNNSIKNDFRQKVEQYNEKNVKKKIKTP